MSSSAPVAVANTAPHLQKSKRFFFAYVKPECKYSKAALDLIHQHDECDVDVKELTSVSDLKKWTGKDTFPQVYLKGVQIGGFDDLKTFFKRYEDMVQSDDESDEDQRSGSSCSD